MKDVIKGSIPNFVLRARSNYLSAKRGKELERTNATRCTELDHLTPKEAFTTVYMNGLWGNSNDPTDTYYSGTGSHVENIVLPYIKVIEQFLNTHDKKLDVVDLGCGDFAVGSRIRKLCGNYIACDVVEPLIFRNREKYKELNVDFRVLDLATDALPNGEVVFIRQVLQHLSNNQIATVLPKLQEKYKYLILTEHLPASKNFKANLGSPLDRTFGWA